MVYEKQDPFENRMRRLARESLALQELRFAAEYAGASDQELVECIRLWKKWLGHTPHAAEMIGGKYILTRFGGDWRRALRLGGMALAGPPPKPDNRRIYKLEIQRQKLIFQGKIGQDEQTIMQLVMEAQNE